MNRSFEREMQVRAWEQGRLRGGFSESPQRSYWQQPVYRNTMPHSLQRMWTSPKPRIPQPQITQRKADIERGTRHRSKKVSDSMFKHFKYPDKVPNIPEKIHKAQLKRGRINSAVNDSEMHPSYSSHKQNRVPSPSSISSSEEELFYRAEEDSLHFSDQSSFDEEDPMPESDDEPAFAIQTPVYQEVEPDSFHSHPKSVEHVPSRRSSRSPAPREPPKHRHKRSSSSEYDLAPLHEEEFKAKKSHKAQAPRSMPEPKHRPRPMPQAQFMPQPILYPMPQPFPMPIPFFQPQYFYPPEAQKPPQEPKKPMELPEKREMSTQWVDVTPTAQSTQTTEATGTFRPSAFIDALAEIDKKLQTKPSVSEHRIRKPIALEIGLAESKSLAERFQEKLPDVQAKLVNRSTERAHTAHREKSTTELLGIRRELLRPPSSTPRHSSLSTDSTSERRMESPCLRTVDRVQLEKADRLAAGKSSIVVKKPVFTAGSGTPDRSLSRIEEESKSAIDGETPRRASGSSRRPVKIQ